MPLLITKKVIAKKARPLFRLALWLWLLLPALAYASSKPLVEQLPFTRLLAEQGISIGSVEAIHQDREGYMWFGGLDGLVRFDGYNWPINSWKQ